MEEKMAEVKELENDLGNINKELSHLNDHFERIKQEKEREE